MGFWMMFFYWIASMVATALLAEKPKYENAKAANENDASIPTIDQTAHVPVVWGKNRLRRPMVAWYGDYYADPIKKTYSSSGFLGIGASKQTVVTGYRYYWGQHLAICHGPVTLHKVWLEEKVAWSGSQSTAGEIILRDEFAYGGLEKGGGYRAVCDWTTGDGTGARNAYLVQMLGEDVPAYRQVASLVWRGPSAALITVQEYEQVIRQGWTSGTGSHPYWITIVELVTNNYKSGYIGLTPQPKAISVEVSRYPNLLGSPNGGKIGDDANAIEIIYECLTDSNWGQGVPSSLVDVAAFQSAATTCSTEGFGLSLVWDQESNVDEVIRRVCDVVDAQVYRDFRTGKFTIKLIRGGYDISTLPVLNESNVVEVSEYTTTTYDGTTNEVTVNYMSRAQEYQSLPRVAQDQSNISIQNEVINKTFDMPEIKLGTLADRVAWRELNTRSQPWAKIVLVANREAYAYGPGDLFKFVWPRLGIESMAVRVVSASIGAPKSGRIRLTLIQDIFNLPNTAFVSSGDPGITDMIPNPAPVTTQVAVELPYYINRLEDRSAWAILAKRPNVGCQSADVYLRSSTTDTNAYIQVARMDAFTPCTTIRDAFGSGLWMDDGPLVLNGDATVTNLRSTNEVGARSGNNLIYFEDTGEWAAFSSAVFQTDGSIHLKGIWRGIMGTGQTAHAAGSRVWFVDAGSCRLPDDFIPSDASTLWVRLLPSGPRGAVAMSDAQTLTISIPSTKLAARPLPPGRITVNGVLPTTISGEAYCQVEHRNKKTLPDEEMTLQSDPGTATADGVYTAEVWLGTTLLRTLVNGTTDVTATYTPTMRLADSTDPGSVAIRWRATSNGLNSAWNYSTQFKMTGLGMCLGEELGGTGRAYWNGVFVG